jgi:hypothetical protein
MASLHCRLHYQLQRSYTNHKPKFRPPTSSVSRTFQFCIHHCVTAGIRALSCCPFRKWLSSPEVVLVAGWPPTQSGEEGPVHPHLKQTNWGTRQTKSNLLCQILYLTAQIDEVAVLRHATPCRLVGRGRGCSASSSGPWEKLVPTCKLSELPQAGILQHNVSETREVSILR